jgi:hypothetical protein
VAVVNGQSQYQTSAAAIVTAISSRWCVHKKSNAATQKKSRARWNRESQSAFMRRNPRDVPRGLENSQPN